MRASSLWLAVALLLAAVIHGRVLGSPLLGFDDFGHAERAQFADRQNPKEIFTTSHFGGSKYRPLGRVALYLCQLWDDAALAHRLRNFLFHLVAIALIYGIGLKLGASHEVAGLAATLFGVHPLIHQNVSAASFINTMAYSFMLGALYLFLSAYRSLRASGIQLFGVSLLMVLALLSYEATIIMLGCAGLYVLLQWREQVAPANGWKKFLLQSAAALSVPVIILLAIRQLFVQAKMPITPAGVILKNLILYLGSLVLPVDLLFLNTVFDFPMPQELMRDAGFLFLLGFLVVGFFVALTGLTVAVWRQEGLRQALRVIPWARVCWLLAAAVLSLLPFLVFTDHLSETYQYLPVAFFSLLLTFSLASLLRESLYFRVTLGLLIILATSASYLRSNRVQHSAQIAERIVSETTRLVNQPAAQKLWFAAEPNSLLASQMGIYGLKGLNTIDLQDNGFFSMQSALRLRLNDDSIQAAAVSFEELTKRCTDTSLVCLTVSDEGQVRRFQP